MSTGAKHYAAAERLLALAEKYDERLVPPDSPYHAEGVALIRATQERAQVHATLALAAASAYTGIMRDGTYGGRGL